MRCIDVLGGVCDAVGTSVEGSSICSDINMPLMSCCNHVSATVCKIHEQQGANSTRYSSHLWYAHS